MSAKAAPEPVVSPPTPPAPAKKATFPGKFEDFTLTAREVFMSESLPYGPAPESSASVRAWLDAKGGRVGCFIDGKWHLPEGRRMRKSVCAATLETLAETVDAVEEDVDLAMEAAARAQEKWAALTCHERARHLYSLARHVAKHERVLAVLEAMDNGKPFRETKTFDVKNVVRHLYHHAGWAQVRDRELPGYKPLGVVVAVTPWNFPLMLEVWKIAASLAMGNTVVLKPASVTRLSALLLAEIFDEAGLPPGVVNVVTGSGAIGSYMVDHPVCAKIAFTGSTEIGRHLRERTAGSGKPITLELGGKSPLVVFENADLDSAVEGVVDGILGFNVGQICSASSRILVQESVYDRFIAKLKRRMDTFKVSHSLEKDIDIGAVIDKNQYESVRGFVERAEAAGAEVYKARVELPSGAGYFWPPTLVTNVSPAHEIVREEVFSCVAVAMPFRDPAEALALANNCKFGLAASVWTEDVSLALEMAVSIKAGSVWVNAHNLFDAAAGFGGYRQSGFGRDGGREGLYSYVKPAWLPAPAPGGLTFPTTREQIRWPSATPPGPAAAGGAGRTTDAAAVIDRTAKLYYGGKQQRPDGNYSRPVRAPDGRLVSEVPEGNRKDMRNAVAAANKAAPGWGRRSAHNRAQILYFIAENLMARRAEFADRVAVTTGRDAASCELEVELSVQRLWFYAAYADKFGGLVKETTLYGLVVSTNEPVGVVGVVCPREYPLLGFVSLVAPLIVRGNTVVAVPSDEAPLCACDLYQVLETSDLPDGVLNIITGDAMTLTKTLAEHEDVEGLWFMLAGDDGQLGSRLVEFSASANMKRTLCSYGAHLDWESDEIGTSDYFLRAACECKNIHVPFGELK